MQWVWETRGGQGSVSMTLNPTSRIHNSTPLMAWRCSRALQSTLEVHISKSDRGREYCTYIKYESYRTTAAVFVLRGERPEKRKQPELRRGGKREREGGGLRGREGWGWGVQVKWETGTQICKKDRNCQYRTSLYSEVRDQSDENSQS